MSNVNLIIDGFNSLTDDNPSITVKSTSGKFLAIMHLFEDSIEVNIFDDNLADLFSEKTKGQQDEWQWDEHYSDNGAWVTSFDLPVKPQGPLDVLVEKFNTLVVGDDVTLKMHGHGRVRFAKFPHSIGVTFSDGTFADEFYARLRKFGVTQVTRWAQMDNGDWMADLGYRARG